MANDEGVAAVDRALSILDLFSEHDREFTLAAIAKRTGLYKSTVLRLAKSLEKSGYLMRREDGTYHLASKVYYLGSIYQRHFHTASVVPPILRSIVAELNEGASFYVQDGEQRVCLHRVDAPRSVRDSVHEGDRLPLKVGAAGHIIRAFGSRIPGERYDQIRREMYVASFGERDPEVSAVACPVFSLNQKFMGALAVSGPRYRIDALGLKPVLRVLIAHARELTSVLGGDADALQVPASNAGAPRKRAARVR